METYKQLKARQAEEIRLLPIEYAFTQAKLNKILNDWHCGVADVFTIGGGSVIRKSDKGKIDSLLKRHHKEVEDCIRKDKKGNGFIYEMFLTEFRNYECAYTHDADPVLEMLGITENMFKKNDALFHGFVKACRVVMMDED